MCVILCKVTLASNATVVTTGILSKKVWHFKCPFTSQGCDESKQDDAEAVFPELKTAKIAKHTFNQIIFKISRRRRCRRRRTRRSIRRVEV